MEQNFKDKRVLITGASKGLGKAAAIAFEQKGARLALAARSDSKLAALKESFGDPGKHLIFNLDLLDSTNIKKLTSDVIKKWDGVDVILHCVGGSMGVNETLVDWEDFVKCLKGNIGIASEINRYLAPGMREQSSGSIIHVGSIVGSEARASVPYNTCKAALSGYVRSLGKELALKNIAVNCVTPAAAKTRIFDQMTQEHIDYMLSKIPRNRFAKVNELASLVTWLASEENSFSTSAVFDLSGGRATY